MKIKSKNKNHKIEYRTITNLQILKTPEISSEIMVKHGKKQQNETIQSFEYKIFDNKSKREFTKTYRGEWEQASKKAWRDLKQLVCNSDLLFNITNLQTEESRQYDFRGWTPQKKSYNKERDQKYANICQF